MRKLFIDKTDNHKIIISGEEHKHIAYSLRMKKGDEITVCSQGIDYTAVIVSISKTETVAEVVGKARSVSEPDSDVTLFFGALKGDKNDYIVQKCTELGVRNFVPFVSEFSSVSRDNIRTDRLNRIALEASKQCGRGLFRLYRMWSRLMICLICSHLSIPWFFPMSRKKTPHLTK